MSALQQHFVWGYLPSKWGRPLPHTPHSHFCPQSGTGKATMKDEDSSCSRPTLRLCPLSLSEHGEETSSLLFSPGGCPERQATEPVKWRRGTVTSYLPEVQRGLVACHVLREAVVLAGSRPVPSFLPSEKPCVRCPSFPPGQGQNQLPVLGHLTLPQHRASVGKTKQNKNKSDHKMGLKSSVYRGSRTPIRCLVAFSFQVKMLCASEDLQ